MIRLVHKHKRKAALMMPIAFLFTGDASLSTQPSLYPSISSISPEVGTPTTINVSFRTKLPINAGDGALHVDAKHIHIDSVDTSTSAFNLWSGKPEILSDAGVVSWSGGIMNAPAKGQMSGDVIRVRVTPLHALTTKISVDPASTLLANDGDGTNILEDIGSIVITPHSKGAANPDIDNNGLIDARDVAMLISQIAGVSDRVDDINGDRLVNISDLTALLDIYQSHNKQIS